MGQRHAYTEYHPRWLRRPVSTYWWLQKRSYFAFILREASCIFVAWFVVYLLMLVRAVSEGEMSYRQFLSWSASPLILLVNLVSLLFIVLHAITFFEAAPRAMVVHVGGRRVPNGFVGAAHYLGLLAASVIVVWILLGA
ncbi:MAG: fumarate reductase subunit C [Acidobacteria bacterium]|nr:fumarate reductase subunit C [Acidobacteriota bacterium]